MPGTPDVVMAGGGSVVVTGGAVVVVGLRVVVAMVVGSGVLLVVVAVEKLFSFSSCRLCTMPYTILLTLILASIGLIFPAQILLYTHHNV